VSVCTYIPKQLNLHVRLFTLDALFSFDPNHVHTSACVNRKLSARVSASSTLAYMISRGLPVLSGDSLKAGDGRIAGSSVAVWQ
jgi:hypothetical protein